MLNEAAALRRAGRFAEAAQAYQRLLHRWPDQPDCWYNLAFVQRQLGRFEEALAAYRQALDHGARQPEEIYLNRGVIFADHLGDVDAARRELNAALACNPAYTPALLNLGNLSEDLGEREAATTHYEAALAHDPECWIALARLANIKSAGDSNDPWIGALERALSRPDVASEDKATLGFALGAALDRAGAHERAFAAYTRANQVSRVAAAYDRAAQEQLVDRIAAAFPAPLPGDASGAEPIFICGMFRSGSTLVEQVLAGHPRITAGGELDFIPRLAHGEVAPFPEAGVKLDAAAAARLARHYAEMAARAFPNADLVTDKRPDNFLYIGLIKALFPSAKIVHTTRHPIDNLLSVFFLQLDQRMSYALDLMDCAHYYRQYRRMMAHWQSLYPGDIVEFHYDDFVRAPRANVERLLAFLGLDWSEDCLAFHRRSNQVKTASVWQVREPLYQRASGRWKNYGDQLAPLKAELAEFLPGEQWAPDPDWRQA